MANNPKQQVRILRVLEYTGDLEAIEEHLKHITYGTQTFQVEDAQRRHLGMVTIRSAIIHSFPEILEGGDNSGAN